MTRRGGDHWTASPDDSAGAGVGQAREGHLADDELDRGGGADGDQGADYPKQDDADHGSQHGGQGGDLTTAPMILGTGR